MRRQNPNLAATEAVARRLGPLLPRFVFVGGCATGLRITDPASAPVRVTRDVDVIADLASYGEYSALGERLRSLGFREDDSEGAPACRWAAGDLLLDVMPATGSPLGFTNRWYVEAIRQSREFELAPGVRIRLVTGPLFLATKFEAFLAQGQGDYYMSQDLEDMVSVVDGRIELAEELKDTIPEVRAYLATEFSALLDNDDFLAWLPRQFPDDEAARSVFTSSYLVCVRLQLLQPPQVAGELQLYWRNRRLSMRAYVLALNMILATATASVAAQNESRQTTQGHTTTITGVIIQQGPDYMIAEPNEMTPIAVLQGVDFQTGHFANYMGQMVRVRGILDTTGERKLLRVKSIGDIEKTGAPKQ